MQLNTVHIGRDKHFTILLTNQPKSKIEGHLKFETEDLSKNALAKENLVTKLDFSLMHLLDYNDPEKVQALHKWEFSSRHSSMKNSKTQKTMISVHRKTASGDKWKVSLSSFFLFEFLFELDQLGNAILQLFDGLEFSQAQTFLVGDVINSSF